jgi:3-dehydroquinate synthetase
MCAHATVPRDAALDGGPDSTRWTVAAALAIEYDIQVAPDLLALENDALERLVFGSPAGRRLFVVDEAIRLLYGDRLDLYARSRGLDLTVVSFAVDESVKNVGAALAVARQLDRYEFDRRAEPVVAFGGGVLLDIVGWACSVYRRGTPYIRIPTTLVGLVDAGIGVKTGVNHNGHKNRLGSYHPPFRAILDPVFLTTLPTRHISNGLAEVAKIALMTDAKLWGVLHREAETLVATRVGSIDREFAAVGVGLLTRSVYAMLAELHSNLWETDLARLVDFGHTFSPAFEMHALPDLLHGEAVSIDMAVCCALALHRGSVSGAQFDQILGTLARLGLPLSHPICTPELAQHCLVDTTLHRGGRQRIPLPIAIGAARFVDDISPEEIECAFDAVADFERSWRDRSLRDGAS